MRNDAARGARRGARVPRPGACRTTIQGLPRTPIRGLHRHLARTVPTTPPKRPAACGGSAVAIDGTHAEAYLRARGLSRCRFPALRFHPVLRYRDGNGVRRFPALVAAVTGTDESGSNCAILGVQRTWLDPRRPATAGVATPRKALGRIHGCAVIFGAPADGAMLLVGEGIETVLSVVTAAPEIDAAAALSAGSLGAFAPPAGIARLAIARDNDVEGERAAVRLARRCARAGVAVTVIVPEGGDFNDDLIGLGADALRARLVPLLRFAGAGGE